ncbi:tRNA 2'-phosphotransferase 1 isoform X2 [Cuculus canorus]|uniref:tRNA 2'-phosphotransferase 1 isoform X2 n=1 Tax=Cuculus canorus TaxID=55661 RepID=UPI0023AA45F1|nr:tRNA 2'-phosphotransferase 1 isoform X2 [Cuculus canorus]
MADGGGRRRREDPSVRLSKKLSYVLRHGATAVGLSMGPDGFAEVGALLALPLFAGVSEDDVRRVVGGDPKGRFTLRPHPLRIRANQGHSLPVPLLELRALSPPALPPTLAHGTRRRRWPQIRREGLSVMGRNHIHLAGGVPGDPPLCSGIRADSEIVIFIDGPAAIAANGVILSPGDSNATIPPRFFRSVLQLRPHRCELPLGGPQEGGGDDPPEPQ